MFIKHGKIKKQKDNDLAKQLRLNKPKTQKPANSFSKQWLDNNYTNISWTKQILSRSAG